MKRIICVGNRYTREDSAGPLVYERLRQAALPRDVEVIDGGLRGLDLLPYLEQVERVVFADSVTGSGWTDRVVVLTADEVAKESPDVYDHAAGLAYLLRAWWRTAEPPFPPTFLVGVVGLPDSEAVAAAAELCLSVAAGEHTGAWGRTAPVWEGSA